MGSWAMGVTRPEVFFYHLRIEKRRATIAEKAIDRRLAEIEKGAQTVMGNHATQIVNEETLALESKVYASESIRLPVDERAMLTVFDKRMNKTLVKSLIAHHGPSGKGNAEAAVGLRESPQTIPPDANVGLRVDPRTQGPQKDADARLRESPHSQLPVQRSLADCGVR